MVVPCCRRCQLENNIGSPLNSVMVAVAVAVVVAVSQRKVPSPLHRHRLHRHHTTTRPGTTIRTTKRRYWYHHHHPAVPRLLLLLAPLMPCSPSLVLRPIPCQHRHSDDNVVEDAIPPGTICNWPCGPISVPPITSCPSVGPCK